MKFPVVELIDRYAIAQVKFENLNGINADEVEFYRKQLEEEYNLESVQGLISGLVGLHKQIWAVEDDFKKLKIDNQPLEEIGRRALFVRDLNNSRVAFKNQIAERLGSCIKEHKNYAGQRSVTFSDFYNVYDYSDKPYTIHYLDYSTDLDQSDPNFQYKYIEYLQHSKDIKPNDVVIISNPYVCGNFQEPLIDYLNWWYNNNPNPFVMLSSRWNIPRNVRFPVYTDMFHEHATQWWLKDYRSPVRTHRNYTVSYTSTKDYVERRYLYNKIKQLVPGAFTSYSCLHSDLNRHPQEYTAEFIEQIGPVIEQTAVLGATEDFINMPHDIHNNSYASVILDTLYGGSHPEVFFSEKVFNAIAHQQLFFYGGSAGSIERLRQAGYHVFEEIIDLSYDQISNDQERVIAFTNSVLKFASRPERAIQQDYMAMFDKIQQNLETFNNKKFSDKIDRAIALAFERRQK